MSIEEETEEEDRPRPAALTPLTRSYCERGRKRPKPRTRPSTDSSRAICGGVVGRGVDGPFDDADLPSYAEARTAHPPVYGTRFWNTPPRAAPGGPPGDSFLSLDYSDDEDIDEGLHTAMFVHGRRASERTASAARTDALFFTLQPADGDGDDVDEAGWEAYGLAQTEGKRERARERRERRALLAAFPEPPRSMPTPSPTPAPKLGMLKHRAISEWVKESTASVSVSSVCESAASSVEESLGTDSRLGHEHGHDRSGNPSPLSWQHGTSTANTTPELTPPRAQRARGRGACGRRMTGREKLLPLVPYEELDQPFRFERHPYAAAALNAEKW
ncbi:uncharacterized protein B0H18DRAFT_1013024 [Fomitopsis serialis]|uniref:uncharacterized protein n=1 Tax=Fomitopsis serialis TaxID=139415 RepID=UPI002007A9B1|nr:uncharacterized protein B0H18DRAFT_1013024 [Neoantrodia serialis]KAH9924015.1 hypothetical protein B0H18DRAFT_1013024 [Neoantrodia serialis]